MKKYKVKLSSEEREQLRIFVSKGKRAAKKIRIANMLLKADESAEGEGWIDERISKTFQVTTKTVERLRKRFVEEGFDAVLEGKACKRKPVKLTGELEAKIVALRCQEDPPSGYGRWTLSLLANKVVELGYITSISHETVRQVLKKTK